jgi:hypothetical protein
LATKGDKLAIIQREFDDVPYDNLRQSQTSFILDVTMKKRIADIIFNDLIPADALESPGDLVLHFMWLLRLANLSVPTEKALAIIQEPIHV